jgi:tetratricopeptide (TPR) repeat protein
MIELMLEAERAMGIGLFDNAERLYRQVVALDPKNSIAVTGLARVALERGDQRGAYVLARQALAIDPDNPVASHLAHRMAEQLRMRGEPIPDDDPPPLGSDRPDPAGHAARTPAVPAPRTGLVGRILRRRR